MKTDEKDTNDRASAGDASGGQAQDMEEIIDLVDEVPPDDDSSEPEQAPEVKSETEQGDEELMDLTGVVEESSSEPETGDTALEGGAEEIVEPEGDQGSEEEEPIELADEVVPEVDSAQEQEEVAGEAELAELSEAETSIPELEEDGLIDDLGLEISEEGPEILAEEGPADEDLGTPEEDEESVLDIVEPQPEAEDLPELESEEPSVEQEPEPSVELAQEAPPSEGVPEPVGGALEQAVLEKLSDEKLEEIVTRIAKQTIEGKVERILLEAAEAAIAKEIDRLKQAL